MARFTYANMQDLIEKELDKKLEELTKKDESKYYSLLGYSDVKLTDKKLFDLYQVWHDRTHMVKRTIFCIPKVKAKEVCELYRNGEKAQLEGMLDCLIVHALKL